MTEIKVFAGFDSDSRILYVFKKRPLKFHRETTSYSRLYKELSFVPPRGVLLCITLWHNSFPVKLEVMKGHDWTTIYKLQELPDDRQCLAGCHKL